MDWSEREVELIISDYFSMLEDELLNRPYNKSFHKRALSPLLNKRSDSSIEFKHRNISASLVKQGLPYIKGYMPLANYQRILDQKIIEHLQNERNSLIPKFEYFAESSDTIMKNPDFTKMLTKAPEIQIAEEPAVVYERKPIKINYIEREQKNASLGLKGEELVIAYEAWRLKSAGKENLIDKIEWVSKEDDGAGFDILSKNKNGTDRYIEVKTTKLGKETPFYFSTNEYQFSKKTLENYHLYRLYNFSESPKIFFLNGDFDSFCQKQITQYKGYF